MSRENTNKSIGIFDSGIGGLTVVKEIINLLPGEKLIYLGDTARVPYGIKSKETVIKYALSNADFLLSRGIKILVVACNTASAYSIDVLKEKLSIPVIGVIEPGAKKAVESTKNGNIAVIGTPSTIRSGAYTNEIMKINPDLKIFSKSCPLFVPLAEEGWHNGKITSEIISTYMEEIISNDVDVIILGCTHYPLLKPAIQEVVGENVTLIDSAEEIAREINKTIGSDETTEAAGHKNEFYLTDISESFINIAGKFLGEDLDEVNLTDI